MAASLLPGYLPVKISSVPVFLDSSVAIIGPPLAAAISRSQSFSTAIRMHMFWSSYSFHTRSESRYVSQIWTHSAGSHELENSTWMSSRQEFRLSVKHPQDPLRARREPLDCLLHLPRPAFPTFEARSKSVSLWACNCNNFAQRFLKCCQVPATEHNAEQVFAAQVPRSQLASAWKP